MGKITIEVKINTFGKMKHPNECVSMIYRMTLSSIFGQAFFINICHIFGSFPC